jgi:hypothetical protein
MIRRVLSAIRGWWNSPTLLDQFKSVFDSGDVLELTEDMRYQARPIWSIQEESRCFAVSSDLTTVW